MLREGKHSHTIQSRLDLLIHAVTNLHRDQSDKHAMFLLSLTSLYIGVRVLGLVQVARIPYDEWESAMAREELVRIGKPALPFLEQALKNPSGSEWNIFDAYARIGGTSAYPLLCQLAQRDVPSSSAYAMWALGATHDQRALPFLVDKLNGGRWTSVAAKALGDLGSEEAVQPLAHLVKEGADIGGCAYTPRSLGSTAAFALAKCGKPGAMALALILNSESSSEDEIRRAAGALAEAKNPATADALVRYLRGPRAAVARDDAVLALASIGDARAFDFAAKQAAEESPSEKAFASLLALGDRRSVAIVERAASSLPERRALEVLGALQRSPNKACVRILARMLQRQEHSIRRDAIWALGEKGDPSVVLALEVFWSQAEEERGYIELALSRLHRPGVEALLRVYEKADVGRRMAMIQLFGKSHEPAAVPLLRKCLSDPEAFVREDARIALTRIAFRY